MALEAAAGSVGLAVAKAGGSKAALAAYKKLIKDDAAKRLAKRGVSDLPRPSPQVCLRRWLRTSGHIEEFMEALLPTADPAVRADLARAVDGALGSSRHWRKLSAALRAERAAQIVDNLLDELVRSLGTDQALAFLANQAETNFAQLSARVGGIRDEVREGFADLVATSPAEFQLGLQQCPVVTRETLTRLYDSDSQPLARVVHDIARADVDPHSLLQQWTETPPATVQGSHAAAAALGVLAHGYFLPDCAVRWFGRAVEWGSPNPGLMRALAGAERTLQATSGTPGDQLADEARALLATGVSAGYEKLAEGLGALLDGDAAGAVVAFDAWVPGDSLASAWRTKLRVHARLVNGFADGLAGALEALEADTAGDALPELLLLRSRLLNMRAQAGQSPIRTADLALADEYACAARDAFRAARQPSAAAVIAAIDAAGLAGDRQRILTLGTSWAETGGQATASEERSQQVTIRVVGAALSVGFHQRAQASAEQLPEGFYRRAALATCEEGSPDPDIDKVRDLWASALDVATADDEKLQAWQGLASTGSTELSGLDEHFGTSQPQLVALLRARVAQVTGSPEVAIDLLMPHRRAGAAHAMVLAEAYERLGRRKDAANTLIEAGREFGNPDLTLDGAGILYRIGEKAEAMRQCVSVLASVGGGWPGRSRAQQLQAQILANNGDLQAAAELLANVVHAHPKDASARWALITVNVVRAQYGQAWSLYQEQELKARWRDGQDAGALLEAAFFAAEDRAEVLRLGLEVVRDFPDDERLIAQLLMRFVSPDTPVPPELVEPYQRLLAEFVQRWPDSRWLRQISLPEDATAEQIRASLDANSSHDPGSEQALRELAEQVRDGRAPAAFLAIMSGRNHTEVLTRRLAGPLQAFSPFAPEQEEGESAALASLSSSVVIDLSAAIVMAELDQDLPDVTAILDGAHRSVIIPDTLLRDISLGTRNLAAKPSGHYAASTETTPDYFTEEPPDRADSAARTGDKLAKRAKTLQGRTVSPDQPPLFPKPDSESGPVIGTVGEPDFNAWEDPLRLAQATGNTLWSDDLPTRQLAREMGVAAFSTLDLVAVVSRAGRLRASWIPDIRQALLLRLVADVPLDPPLIAASAAAEQWAAAATAVALSRPRAWVEPNVILTVWQSLCLAIAEQAPRELPTWCSALASAAVDVDWDLGLLAARGILAQILSLAVFAARYTDGVASACVKAVRAAASRKSALDDPLPLVVENLSRVMQAIVDPQSAVNYVLRLFGPDDDEIHGEVLSILLRP